MVSYAEFSYKTLHELVRRYSYIFRDLALDLSRSNLKYSVEEWFAMCMMTIVLCSPSFVILAISVYFLIFDISLALFTGGVFYTLIVFMIFVLFYIYPSQAASSRKKSIDNALHFATIYMTTLAGTGAPPQVLFRILGSFDEFGEIAVVARKITRDVEMFGMDIAEALARSADKVPSESFRELLWGIKSTVTSGGDLKKFLEEKAEGFKNQYKRQLEEFTKVLSIFMEIYITVVIVGTVFVIVMTTIMSIIGGGGGSEMQFIQIMLVAVGLPFASIVFVILIKSISPSEVGKIKRRKLEEIEIGEK